MRHFLDLSIIPKQKLRDILEVAKQMKTLRFGKKSGALDQAKCLDGQIVGLLFEKPSTRTRISFDAGVRQLGGQPMLLSASELQISNGEDISDTARVLSKYLDVVMMRTFEEKTLLDFAANSSIPVINGLTNRSHPCQVMADIMTFEEARGGISDKRVVWVGDSNNVCLSYIHAATQFGFSLTITSPKEFSPNRDDITLARKQGGKIDILLNPFEAVRDADLIVTDTYFSMHSEKRCKEEKLHLLRDYQVNRRLIANAKKDVIFLHCLPAHRGVEVSGDVIDGKNSMVFEAAENRLHVQKAILAWCVEKQ